MMFLRFVFAGILILISFAFLIPEFSGKDYPKDYFISPVQHEILLSGTFGELRSNHFHSGIDIKPSNGKPGDPVLAAAEGYVSRIYVSSRGYGKAVYVAHPNGYTTVYAHLDRFAPEIAEYVRTNQYQKKSFAVNLFPTPSQFVLKQGEPVGQMGTSGSSSGTHLHFEIRKSSNSKPINPLAWGLKVSDHRSPTINRLVLYSQTDAGFELYRNISLNSWNNDDTILVDVNNLGVGIESFDRCDKAPNKNGIYSVQLFWDDNPCYQIKFSEFHFKQTRYINSHIDYSTKWFENRTVQQLFNLPGNQFELCRQAEANSLLSLENNAIHHLEIKVSDRMGNSNSIRAVIKALGIREKINNQSGKPVLKHNEAFLIQEENSRVSFNPGSVYQNIFFDYDEANDQSAGILSKVIQLHHPHIPVHRYFDLWIKAYDLPATLKNKAFLAYCGKNGIVNYGGKWINHGIQSRSRNFGQYCIMIDTIPPTIEPVAISDQLTKNSKFVFKVQENYPVGGDARGIRYKATIDKKWVLAEYDAKNDLILYQHTKELTPGKHIFQLEVNDDRNNITVFTKSILAK